MKTILLFGHGGYDNRGCEAIVRTTAQMLRQRLGDIHLVLASYDPIGDKARGFGLVDEIIPHASTRWSLSWARARVADRVKPNLGNQWWAHPIRQAMNTADVLLSIGGDNYCYEEPDYYFFVDDMFRKAGKLTVLWGASVDVEQASEGKLNDLRAFDLITVRESNTIRDLASVGITSNVRAVADPAFLMVAEPVDTRPFWPQAESVVGLNVSPLLTRYAIAGSAVADVAKQVVRYIVNDLGLGVVLVPHVVSSTVRHYCDALFMRGIMEEWPVGSVSMMPSTLNAPQTKYVISQCRFFVGARTHSTIAAISQGVPTISIGYSIKSRGINNDIFGHTRYVTDVKHLDGTRLRSAVDTLVAEESRVRQLLSLRVPELKKSALQGADELALLMGASKLCCGY